jgi:cell division protein FtsN
MSPKLRSKMNLDDEPDESSGNKMANIIALVMLVAIVVMGSFFFTALQRSKADAKVKAAAATKAAAAQAVKDSLDKAQQDSVFAARSDSTAKADAKNPKPKPPATTTAGGSSAPPTASTPPAPVTKFGIDVGSFLTQDRANAEQTKLQASTSLSARVVPKSEDGGTSYHVVLGEFTSRKDAEKKANDLIVAQSVHEATVTKLK